MLPAGRGGASRTSCNRPSPRRTGSRSRRSRGRESERAPRERAPSPARQRRTSAGGVPPRPEPESPLPHRLPFTRDSRPLPAKRPHAARIRVEPLPRLPRHERLGAELTGARRRECRQSLCLLLEFSDRLLTALRAYRPSRPELTTKGPASRAHEHGPEMLPGPVTKRIRPGERMARAQGHSSDFPSKKTWCRR
jgi:hypothetical protein